VKVIYRGIHRLPTKGRVRGATSLVDYSLSMIGRYFRITFRSQKHRIGVKVKVIYIEIPIPSLLRVE
jgi:hypothetical protein